MNRPSSLPLLLGAALVLSGCQSLPQLPRLSPPGSSSVEAEAEQPEAPPATVVKEEAAEEASGTKARRGLRLPRIFGNRSASRVEELKSDPEAEAAVAEASSTEAEPRKWRLPIHRPEKTEGETAAATPEPEAAAEVAAAPEPEPEPEPTDPADLTPVEFQPYLGMDKWEAIARAKVEARPWRIAREDNNVFPTTADENPARVNFHIRRGKIIGATSG